MDGNQFLRNLVNEIDHSQTEMIIDVYKAQCGGIDLLVGNRGYIYSYEQLEEIAHKARAILRVVNSIKSTYDTGEFNRWADSVDKERLVRVNEENDEAIKRYATDRKRKNATTFVYLMFNERSGHYKIGFSKEPKFREKTLQSDDPQVTLIKAYKGIKADERHFHKLFADKRFRGEWFSLSEEDLTQFHAFFNDNRTE